ncbi:MAG: DUF58 domain-containing protein [Asticcacaulis sp.]|uniref:DUF58 domain-containing protein n=1 Tax=Asticcacaulis sp. TaxID=1872648 RepID=UPI0039E5D2D4
MSYDPIPPQVRSRLKNLRLTSRRAAGGNGIGLHNSHSRGAGLEFAQYRPYEPGDELRQIDWKLFARSDRFFVREAERESPLAAWILLDASASMSQTDAARPGWSRLDAAKGLAVCIAELALRQGDRFGWMGLGSGLGNGGLRVLPPAGGGRQRDRLLLDLYPLAASGQFPETTQLAPLWARIGKQDLVVVLSDCFDPACLDLMQRLAIAGREVLAIQILTAEERDFPFQGGYRFQDPETGKELLGDGPALRADFLRRFGEAQRALNAQLDAVGIRHTDYVLDQALDAPLRRLFGAHDATEYA